VLATIFYSVLSKQITTISYECIVLCLEYDMYFKTDHQHNEKLSFK